MKVIVKPHKIKIELEHDYNSGEYNVQECNFEFSDEYTGLCKVVIFSNSNVTKEIQIYDDKCIVPAEVLQNEGVVGIGVYGYEVEYPGYHPQRFIHPFFLCFMISSRLFSSVFVRGASFRNEAAAPA